MATIYFYTIASVLIVSALSLIGVISLVLSGDKINRIIMFLVSLSAGVLLGDSFLHLIPEAVEKNYSPNIWLWLLVGILIFFILEKIIHWRHCHIPSSTLHHHAVGKMNLIGDGLHNFLDGILIAGSYLVSLPLGIATTLAVIAHEMPQEISDFGVLLYAGYHRSKAIFFNFLSALMAVAGSIIALTIGSSMENFPQCIIPLTAGCFIYIAAADLIPELRKDNCSLPQASYQLISIVIGIAIMLLLKKLS